MREDDAEEVGLAGGGGEVDDRAHQESSGAAAFDGDFVGVAVTAHDELLGGGDEVGEGVALEGHLAGVVPCVAQFSAAADVGVGHDDAAVEQREARGREAHWEGVAIRPVAVDIEGIGGDAAEAVAAVDDGDGDQSAVGGSDPEALGGVVGGVEAAGDLLLLEQLRLADGESGVGAGDVVLVDRGRRDQRLVAVAEDVGGEDAVDVRGCGVGGFGEGDLDRGFELIVRGETQDLQCGQAELAASGDGEALEEVEVLEREVGVERDQFGPVVAAGRGGGRGDDAEVLACVVAADGEETVPMVRVILLFVHAWSDETKVCLWFVGGEKAELVGGVAAGLDHQVEAVAGAGNAKVETLVLFVEYLRVLLDWLAEGVAQDAVLALGGLVLGGVEEGARVGGPGQRSDALRCVWEVGERTQGADVEGVLAEAGGIGGVCEEVAVGADGHGSDVHEGLALGQRVYVEDDLLGLGWIEGGVEVGTGCGASAMDGILAALDRARGVEPVAEAVGNALVGLLNVGDHLVVQLGLQLGGGCHDGGGVGVLGFQVGEQLGRALVAHPAEVVVQSDTMQRCGRGIAAGDRRLSGRIRCGAGVRHC